MKKFAYFVVFVFIFCCQQVFAQPELDTTFNGTGTYSTGNSFTFQPQDVVVQPDNKPVALSWCINTSTQIFQFCLVRMTESGTPDTTFEDTFPFSEPGTALIAVPNSNRNAAGGGRGLLILGDGKILAIGSATFSAEEKPVLIRLNSNGTLDSSFGSNGVINYSVNGYFSKAVLQPDGKIVVVGTSGNNQLAARILPDGTPDNTFGSDGFKFLIHPDGNSSGASISLQADGKIVLGGAIASSTNSYLATRLNFDGSLDNSFDGDGYKSISVSNNSVDTFASVAVKPDGRIVGMGYKNILFQFNSDGSFDTTFDSDGSRSALNGLSESRRMIVSASGKITVAGFPTLDFGNGPVNYRLARYLPNGVPDAGFSGDGFLDLDVSGHSYDGADGIAFDARGRLLIGGRTWSGCCDYPWQYSFYSAARLIAAPTLNAGFSGRVMEKNGKPVFNAALILKNGSEIIAYARTNQFGYFNFNNIPTNKTYTISTIAKSLSFYDRTVLIDDQVTSFLIFGN